MYTELMLEEDMFPRFFTHMEKREYGLLFFDEDNKDSYDSNHAVLYGSKILDLKETLQDVIRFYRKKDIVPNIYQATEEEGYLRANAEVFSEAGFELFEEIQKFMLLSEKNTINVNSEIKVKQVTKWESDFENEIFMAAGEPWEISVAKKMISKPECLFFAAYFQERPVGMAYAHVSGDVCRYDYILVAKEYRKIGCARAILSYMTDYCRENNITNCFQWPAHKSSEDICYEAGFREIFEIKAGRATWKEK